MKVLVAQSCLTLYELMDYSLPDSFVHGILQARILEWVATSISSCYMINIKLLYDKHDKYKIVIFKELTLYDYVMSLFILDNFFSDISLLCLKLIELMVCISLPLSIYVCLYIYSACCIKNI